MVPAGTVVSYAGEVVDTGSVVVVANEWLLCNGAPVSSQSFPELFQAIQASHGNGSDAGNQNPRPDFNLPDFRGYLLRGVDGVAGRDPEKDSRGQNHMGGNVGNRVGSVQLDATRLPNNAFITSLVGDHVHQENVLIHTGGPDVGGGSAFLRGQTATSPAGAHTHSVAGGGDLESRPKNVYVHWIIKARHS